jgi:DNA-binding transcriptional LysR family regulator
MAANNRLKEISVASINFTPCTSIDGSIMFQIDTNKASPGYSRELWMPRRVNLRQIEALKAVVETGTVSRAAELLNISQPGTSKLITHLELDTGLKLFDRLKGRLAPTEHGMRLYDEIERIFAGVQQVENAITAIRREEQGRVAVGALPALSASFVHRATISFLDSHPDVFCSVESLSSEWVVERVVSRQLDVGLISPLIDNPYLVREPLLAQALVCVMPPDHPLTAKLVIQPKDLNGVPCVAHRHEPYIGRRVAEMFEKYGVEPKISVGANISHVVCEFVAAGKGVSLVHPLSVAGFDSRLITRRFEPDIWYNYQLCRSAEHRNAGLIDAFVEHVRAVAQQVSQSLLSS